MDQHAASLNMTLDKSGNQWKACICVNYDCLEMFEVKALEKAYFEFFAKLGDAMKDLLPE